MQIIKRGEVTRYAFDARDEPVLHVKQEESFQVETEDALTGLIEDDSDDPKVHQFVGDAHVDALNAAWPPKYNPVIGPIHVEGCEAGDVLAVNLEFIDPWRYGFSGILPGIGPYGQSMRWDGQCAEPRVQVIEHLPGPSGHTRDGKGKYSDRLTWDLEPFCGTLATAPEREVFTSLLGQGPFGGNIDCRDVAPGHTILLNSYHEGGLLYIGDIHGGQGDTEFTGIADETRATVQLNCRVIKNQRLPTVRIVKPESIVAVGINLPMEQAVYDACANMIDWLNDEYDIKPQDTYIRMSCDPAFRIRTYQMVRAITIQHVVGAEYPKHRLSPRSSAVAPGRVAKARPPAPDACIDTGGEENGTGIEGKSRRGDRFPPRPRPGDCDGTRPRRRQSRHLRAPRGAARRDPGRDRGCRRRGVFLRRRHEQADRRRALRSGHRRPSRRVGHPREQCRRRGGRPDHRG